MAKDKVIIFGVTDKNDKVAITIDDKTGLPPFISATHHEVHEGKNYIASISLTTSNADTKQTIMTIQTPNTAVFTHFTFLADVSSSATCKLYEAVTAGDATDTVTAYNSDRNSTNTAGCTIKYFDEDDAANVSGGTLLWQNYLGSGKTSHDGIVSRNEFILKPNTTYAVIVANTVAAANNHNIIFNWYEHTDSY